MMSAADVDILNGYYSPFCEVPSYDLIKHVGDTKFLLFTT